MVYKHFRYHVLSFVYFFFHFLHHFFNHFTSCLLPVVQKFSKKWKITIFLVFFFIVLSFFFSFLLPVVELMKNDKTWWKMIKKMIKNNEKKTWKTTRGKLQFSKKWKNAIFLEFFSFFLILFSFFFFFCFSLFIIFHHFCFQWCKNFARKGKLQFSSSFFSFFLSFFSLFLSFFLKFLLPVVELMKNDKKMMKTD